jgi:hypothetical protein
VANRRHGVVSHDPYLRVPDVATLQRGDVEAFALVSDVSPSRFSPAACKFDAPVFFA